jgi:hypothetical protein
MDVPIQDISLTGAEQKLLSGKFTTQLARQAPAWQDFSTNYLTVDSQLSKDKVVTSV